MPAHNHFNKKRTQCDFTVVLCSLFTVYAVRAGPYPLDVGHDQAVRGGHGDADVVICMQEELVGGARLARLDTRARGQGKVI